MVEFTDVRILAFGALGEPHTMFRNPNAHIFLHPPGIESRRILASSQDLNPSIGSGNDNFEPGRITDSRSA